MDKSDRLDWNAVWKQTKRASDEIAPIRNICWVVGSILMIWSYFGDWFFPVIAFGVVGAQVLWAAASFVRALVQTQKSETPPPPDKATEASQPANRIPAEQAFYVAAKKAAGRLAQGLPSEEHEFFVGRWRARMGDRSPVTFFMELHENGTAQRHEAPPHIPSASGDWEYVNGQARVRWSDNWVDVLRCTPNGTILKIAFQGNAPEEARDGTTNAVKEA